MQDRLMVDVTHRMDASSSMDVAGNFPNTGIHVLDSATGLKTGIRGFMTKVNKALKAGLITGLCGLGVYAVAKKLKLADRAADMAHSIEAVPFPGANLYEFLTARHMRFMYIQIADEVASAGEFQHILDIGTGVGYLPIELAHRYPEASVAGIDRSQDMIRIAKMNAASEFRTKRIDFQAADPGSIPFPGRYFDLVTSVIALHHWSDPVAIMEEVYYALKPGGQFWIYDYRREVPEEVWSRSESRLPAYLRIPYKVGPEASWKASITEEKIRDLVSQTRFELVDLDLRQLTIFDEAMPVFNRVVLRKPAQARDEETPQS